MKAVTLAIVGRTNVGKSTLFNCLTKSRQALVVDMPGVTRDRLYGQGSIEGIPFAFVDTCGVDGEQSENLMCAMEAQLSQAIDESDATLFVVDAKAGLMPEDTEIAKRLRLKNKPVYVIVNKTDGLEPEVACGDFYRFGFDKVIPISAAHNRGIQVMMKQIAQEHHLSSEHETHLESQDESQPSSLKIAVLGRPNVGKSTLINRMLQEDRVVVYDMPGTTRDSIYIPLTRHQKNYTLIDTAGVRRKSRVYETVEKFSVVKTLSAIQDADCVVLVLNAQEDVFDQDLNLIRYIQQAGRSMVIALNKWDGLDHEAKEAFKKTLKRKIQFLPKVRIHTISALHGTGVGDLFDLVEQAYQSASQDLSSAYLTNILERALGAHPPPLSQGRRIRLKYVHCIGQNPIRLLVHGNQTDAVPDHYKKYLTKTFTQALGLVGAALRLEFRTSDNPFKGRRNALTQRQLNKKKRLMKHVKRAKH